MADDGYMLSQEAVRKTALAVRRILGTPRTSPGRGPNNFTTGNPPIRVGTAYGNIPAGTTNSPGVGEVIFDRIDRATLTFVDAEQLPETVYNLIPRIIPSGARVACAWDQTIVRSADGTLVPECGWVMGDARGSGSDQPLIKLGTTTPDCIKLQTTATRTLWWTPSSVVNSDDTVFEVITDLNGSPPHVAVKQVRCKVAGIYRVCFDVGWGLSLTNSGSPSSTVDIASIWCKNITASTILLDSARNIGCTNLDSDITGGGTLRTFVEAHCTGTAEQLAANDVLELQIDNSAFDREYITSPGVTTWTIELIKAS